MPKTSKGNGGSEQPMLPSLDQLPTLPGFTVPAGTPTATPPPQAEVKPPEEEAPPPATLAMPPIIDPQTGQAVNVQKQKTVRLKPEVPVVPPPPGIPPQEAAPEPPSMDDLPPMPGFDQPMTQPVETPAEQPAMPPPVQPSVPLPQVPAPEVPKADVSQATAAAAMTVAAPDNTVTPGIVTEAAGVSLGAAVHYEAGPICVPPQTTGHPSLIETTEPQHPDLPAGQPHPQLTPQPLQYAETPPPAGAFGTETAAAAVSLTELISGVSGEDAVDVNAVLDEIPGLGGGPSVGGFSWHTLEPCLACWRKAYYTHVMGLVPHRTPRALNWGSLWHACWELWYKFGGQRKYDEPCDAVRQAGAPKMAGEVQRLMYVALKHYAEEEAATWDIRAVENNAIFWGEPERVDGKTVYVPISCRHDLIVAKRKPGTACHPAGPVPHGVYVCDHKTASALTYDLTKGYAMDGQFKTNALVFLKSTEREQFGPLNGIIVSVAIKHKDPAPKSLHRVETAIDEKAIEEFYQYEIKPYALEFYRRLSSERYRGDRNLWPRNTSHCVNRYGCCQFFDLCDIGGYSVLESMFKVDEKRQFDISRLADPPIEVKRASKLSDPKKKAAEEARKERAAKRKEYQEALLAAFSASVQNIDWFDSKLYLSHNNTDKQVMEQLVESLSSAWPVGTAFNYPLQDEEGNPTDSFKMTVTEKGVSWVQDLPVPEPEVDASGKKKKTKKVTPHKGVLTYKRIAEAICQDWWDLDRVDPTDAQ